MVTPRRRLGLTLKLLLGLLIFEQHTRAGTASSRGTIPKIIHQSWKVETLPLKLRRWQQTMKEMHSGWEYRLWTDAENRELVQEHYPWLLQTYDRLPGNIMRADMARIMYLHQFGGLYADLDFEVLQPFDGLIKGESLVLAAMTDDLTFNHSIPNAWMASAPGHRFWQFCLQHIISAASPCSLHAKKGWFGLMRQKKWDWVEDVTGPPMLLQSVKSYNATLGLAHVKILEPGIIFPIDWRYTSQDWKNAGFRPPKSSRKGHHEVCDPRQAGFSELACKAKFPDAYAITYWMHSW